MLTIAMIKEEIKPIATEHDVKKVYLFGSYAKGCPNEESDVDLLIENGPNMTLLGLSSFMRHVKEALNLPVDVVTIDGINQKFYNCISQDKVLIYEA